jgi:hypothetical protein
MHQDLTTLESGMAEIIRDGEMAQAGKAQGREDRGMTAPQRGCWASRRILTIRAGPTRHPIQRTGADRSTERNKKPEKGRQ